MYWEISSMRADYTQYANLGLTGHCTGKVTKLKIKWDN